LITINLDAFGADSTARDIGFVNKYMISADGDNFEIIFTANFLISSHAFNTNTKTLQFNIESGLDKENVGEIIIPQDLIDGELTILLDGKEIPAKVNKTNKSSIVSIEFDEKGKYTLEITPTKYLGNSGGCLIATAAFGSEMASQVQFLREIRDNIVLQTESGSAFMVSFNQFYYSFSPAIADYERENSIFKEVVKLTLTPLLISLTSLQYADIDTESEMLVYGIGVILLNIGMYFVAPAILIMKIGKRVNIEKLHKTHE
jgi:hypothetical protein